MDYRYKPSMQSKDAAEAVQFFIPKPHFQWVPFRLSYRQICIMNPYAIAWARMFLQWRERNVQLAEARRNANNG